MNALGCIRVVPVVLLLAAALAWPTAAAAEGSLPERAVYSDPGPVPPPDSVAKEFVDRNAPALRSVTAEELARGVVVEPPARKTRRPDRRATNDVTRLLERAGGTDSTTLGTRTGAILAAILAVVGLALLTYAPLRTATRARSGAL